tara:strand:+ start:518 stop:1366 length:849 start_codon:yes stop_codon:yes gene_type:complete
MINNIKIYIIYYLGYLCNFLENIKSYKLFNLFKSKIKTIKLLKKLNYPTTKILIRNKLKPNDFIVAKPIDGDCGKGIQFFYPFTKIPKSLINNKKYFFEKYEYGKNYRIILYKGQIMSIYKRIIPFVIGDGKTKVSELVKQINKKRLIRNKIQIQKEKQNFIPQKNSKYKVSHLSNFATGGSLKSISLKKIPKKTKKLFIKLQKELNINILSIDLICSNITHEINKQETFCINELEYCNGWGGSYLMKNNFYKLSKFLLMKYTILLLVILLIIKLIRRKIMK